METKDEFLMSRCLSAPDATSLSTSLPQEQVAKTKMLSVVRVQQKECLVLCSMVQICLLLSRKKVTKINYCSHTTKIREALLCAIIKSLRLYNKLTATFK